MNLVALVDGSGQHNDTKALYYNSRVRSTSRGTAFSLHTGKHLPSAFAFTCILAAGIIAFAASCAQKPAELSGIVRAREYRLSSRLGGEVAQQFAQEGAELKAGEPLARMDDSVLKAQRIVLTEGAKSAWATFNDLKAGATPEQLRQARAELSGAEAQYSQALNCFRSEDICAAVDVLGVAPSPKSHWYVNGSVPATKAVNVTSALARPLKGVTPSTRTGASTFNATTLLASPGLLAPSNGTTRQYV